ncbi:MAG: ArnT family glycosyltransferase [Anaerolineales bacterium]
MTFQKITLILVLLALALLGFGAVIYATHYGIGTSPDSVVYIGTANNLQAGKGLTLPSGSLSDEPLTQYPPFYPIVLTGFSLLGSEPYQAARWLAALIFALNILLVGFLLYGLLPEARWISLLGSAGMLLAPAMLEIHVMAWTEPIFILLGMSSLAVLSVYLNAQKTVWLLLAAILSGLALLTRYAGAAYVAAGMLGLLLLLNTTFVKRLLQMLIFAVVSSLPTLAVLVNNRMSAGTATNRTIGFHPVTRSQLWQGLASISGWLGMPSGLPTWLYLLFLAAAAGLLLLVLWLVTRNVPSTNPDNSRQRAIPELILLLALFGMIYGFFLLVSITFVDANTPLDNRILAPIYPALFIIGCYAIGKVYARKDWAWSVRLSGLVVIGLLLVIYTGRSLPAINNYQQNGIGFSSSVWHSSAMLAEVKTLPESVAVYSNLSDAIYLITGHRAVRLPRPFELSNQQLNPDFESEIADMGAQMQAGNAVIVFFNQPGRLENPSEADLTDRLPLEVVYETNEGKIYQIGNP